MLVQGPLSARRSTTGFVDILSRLSFSMVKPPTVSLGWVCLIICDYWVVRNRRSLDTWVGKVGKWPSITPGCLTRLLLSRSWRTFSLVLLTKSGPRSPTLQTSTPLATFEILFSTFVVVLIGTSMNWRILARVVQLRYYVFRN